MKISSREAHPLAESIFSRIDTNNSGYIDYSEFIVSANSLEMTATQENLGLAFDYIDEQKKGMVSIEEIQGRLGDNIPTIAYQ
jgi:calcium-dependent protein kinase